MDMAGALYALHSYHHTVNVNVKMATEIRDVNVSEFFKFCLCHTTLVDINVNL